MKPIPFPKFKRFDLTEHLDEFPPSGSKILVAPLNWGLGHAARCVPILHQLIQHGYEPIIASDGFALEWLQKQFPQLKSYTLPSYNITYAAHPFWFHWKLMTQLPHIWKTKREEHTFTKEIVENESIKLIISDNRFGVYHSNITSIFVTHQIHIPKGIKGWLASKWHQNSIRKFDICWIPDVADTINLSGTLSHPIPKNIRHTYIGLLSSHAKEDLPIRFDLLLLLSGPEPQRTIWERSLIKNFAQSNQKIALVRGTNESNEISHFPESWEVFPFAYGKNLQDLLNASQKVIARTGYSTLMDLAVLEKEALLTPTPNQPEQEYLAHHILYMEGWSISK